MGSQRYLLILACLSIVIGWRAPGGGELRAQPEAIEKTSKADRKRAMLWQALMKALPKKYEPIDAYAENNALTGVLLYSHGATLRFNLATGKVDEIQLMKRLGRINRITFDGSRDGESYVLWCDGRREATIDEIAAGVSLPEDGR